MKKKIDILKSVDILDLIKVKVYKSKPTSEDPSPVRVVIETIEKTKKVIFDESALDILNKKLSERVATMSYYDPKTLGYIEEFAGRMVSELYRHGLVELEDIPEASGDPYGEVKKHFKI